MHITYDLPVAIDDIIEAKQRLAGRIYKTGMPRSNYFSERCKGEIFLKFENMQRTGSFKIRGAFNKLSSLTDAEKRKGVVACSAGNHAHRWQPVGYLSFNKSAFLNSTHRLMSSEIL